MNYKFAIYSRIINGKFWELKTLTIYKYHKYSHFPQNYSWNKNVSIIVIHHKYYLAYGIMQQICTTKYFNVECHAEINPVEYTDPDGNASIHGGKYPGFSEDAPQAGIPYRDAMDPGSRVLGFNIHGTKIDVGIGHLRLWKGDYGLLGRALAQTQGISYTGGAGGEIGFYDYNGKMIRGSDLSKSIGLESADMQLFNKSDNSLLAEYSELSGWVTAFNLTESGSKQDMYTVNTFTFKSEAQAKSFAGTVENSRRDAMNYPHGGNEPINVKHEGKNVIVTWGLE